MSVGWEEKGAATACLITDGRADRCDQSLRAITLRFTNIPGASTTRYARLGIAYESRAGRVGIDITNDHSRTDGFHVDRNLGLFAGYKPIEAAFTNRSVPTGTRYIPSQTVDVAAAGVRSRTRLASCTPRSGRRLTIVNRLAPAGASSTVMALAAPPAPRITQLRARTARTDDTDSRNPLPSARMWAYCLPLLVSDGIGDHCQVIHGSHFLS